MLVSEYFHEMCKVTKCHHVTNSDVVIIIKDYLKNAITLNLNNNFLLTFEKRMMYIFQSIYYQNIVVMHMKKNKIKREKWWLAAP